MIVGVLKEPQPENRISVLPELASELIKRNVKVWIEAKAAENCAIHEEDYSQAGAEIKDRKTIITTADILLRIHPLTNDEIKSTKDNATIIGVYQPLQDEFSTMELNKLNRTIFSMDLIPRTTRAQSMDVLSSMATVAGYKAVLLAANHLPRFFPMFMTAAGTIAPAKVLVLGAGVAGLQAIATARKLGGVVYAFDVRTAAKEEVLSLGGKFIDVEGASDDKDAGGYAVEQKEDFLQRQRAAVHEQAKKSDVIICTAQIPGRPAPKLIFKETVQEMRPGAVIVDLAASSGGNCELTQNDKITHVHKVTIIGMSNLPSDLPQDASKMYGKNLLNFLDLILKEGSLVVNFEDDIVNDTCLTHRGKIISSRVRNFYNLDIIKE